MISHTPSRMDKIYCLNLNGSQVRTHPPEAQRFTPTHGLLPQQEDHADKRGGHCQHPGLPGATEEQSFALPGYRHPVLRVLQLPEWRRFGFLRKGTDAEAFRGCGFQPEGGRDQRYRVDGQWHSSHPEDCVIGQWLNWRRNGVQLVGWMFRKMFFGLQLMINNQTGREGGQDGQERRQVDQHLNEQHMASVLVNSNPQDEINAVSIDTNEANHQQPPSGPILKQPLRLKFKGIIVNRVLGSIYSKNQTECLQMALHSLRNTNYRIRPLKRLSLDELQRRTMIVLIQTTTFLIEQYKDKLIKQAFSALQQPLI